MNRSTAAEAKPRALAGATSRIRPIDMVHLARQTLGDRGLELEVLRLFDDMLAVHFGRLEQSTTRDELIRHLHTIKGASAGVGARAVADLAGAAESGLRAGGPVDPERIEDLHMAIEECRGFVAAVLAEAA